MPASAYRPLLWILVVAAVLRVAYLLQYLELPFFEVPLYDSVIYIRQVVALARGDFGDASLVAMSPLYGYFLFATGVRSSFLVPIVVQQCLGLATIALVYLTALRERDVVAGSAAALLCTGYGLLLHYETKFLTETLAMVLAAAAMWWFTSAPVQKGQRLSAALAGALVGLTVLARASLIFAPFFFVLVALFRWRRPPQAQPFSRRLGRAGAVALGLSLVLGGHAAWNYAHTGLLIPVILVSKTVERTAGQEVHGRLSELTDEGGAASPADVVRQAEVRLEQEKNGSSRAFRVPSIDVTGYLQHFPSKLLRSLSDLEMTLYQYGYYGERSELWVLRATPVTFGILLTLALAGGFLYARREGFYPIVAYLPFLLAPLVTTTLFHPSSRYRLVMILPLLVASGLSVSMLWEARSKRWAQAALGALLLGCSLLAARTLLYKLRQPAMWELSVAEAAAKKGDLSTVEARIVRARRLAGDDPAVQARIHYVLQRLIH